MDSQDFPTSVTLGPASRVSHRAPGFTRPSNHRSRAKHADQRTTTKPRAHVPTRPYTLTFTAVRTVVTCFPSLTPLSMTTTHSAWRAPARGLRDSLGTGFKTLAQKRAVPELSAPTITHDNILSAHTRATAAPARPNWFSTREVGAAEGRRGRGIARRGRASFGATQRCVAAQYSRESVSSSFHTLGTTTEPNLERKGTAPTAARITRHHPPPTTYTMSYPWGASEPRIYPQAQA